MTGPLVLLVDDDRDTRDMYRLVLEMSSYRVADASSVKTAVQAATEFHPDVVVSDWLLPDGDGFSLLEALREIKPARDIPKLAVTGLSLDREAVARAAEFGCELVLTKPVSPSDLVSAIGRALAAAPDARH